MEIPAALTDDQSFIYASGLLAGAESRLESQTRQLLIALCELAGERLQESEFHASHAAHVKRCRERLQNGPLRDLDSELCKVALQTMDAVRECVAGRDYVLHGIWVPHLDEEGRLIRQNSSRAEYVDVSAFSLAEVADLIDKTGRTGWRIHTIGQLVEELARPQYHVPWIHHAVNRKTLGLPITREPDLWYEGWEMLNQIRLDGV